ncbi:membrane dipeptidase [Ralstonia solanacearum]|uniref:membrane dipeptidase n=1 Tax=Ralstonia solanacearum TaxID=305 RepID=UPI000448B127|nr:membrane dipeptidase [Ralstonia solanacearum]EUJ12007.1 hypothetical protein RSP673_23200 [Ralstonia solanacearum P673]MCL9844074.1 membrane dipeptidase [Ralstonia solanacearum]MCL9851397.1 membrane dipeptidase [Ralstonia solanacearum]MCL9853279.1 membrane dipeptidase [Ralstonia solanacearum]MCL9861334.1 membrane dipeptidase [Ralstonia solanacearum]
MQIDWADIRAGNIPADIWAETAGAPDGTSVEITGWAIPLDAPAPAADYPSLDAMAVGLQRLADVVGVAHIGLGTDMLGFTRPPIFDSYAQLPALAGALLKRGFTPAEVGQILGGNYRRVFEAALG